MWKLPFGRTVSIPRCVTFCTKGANHAVAGTSAKTALPRFGAGVGITIGAVGVVGAPGWKLKPGKLPGCCGVWFCCCSVPAAGALGVCPKANLVQVLSSC